MRPDIYVMTSADLPEVMKIENQVYPHPWTEGIFKDCLRSGYHGFLLKQNDELIGYAMISVAVQECHILNICINHGQQGKGLGRYLLEFLLEEAKELQAQSVFLEVRTSNKTAIKLYESMGFNELGIRKNYYPAPTANNKQQREDAHLFALELI